MERPPQGTPYALTGGCACGRVRYEVSAEPVDPGYCHCHTCQSVSGAPVLAYATTPVSAFQWTRGQPRLYRSSGFGSRNFCPDCGTHLTMQVDADPEVLDFTLASLDDPERVAPTFHIWTRSRIGWFEIADNHPRYERSRPADGARMSKDEAGKQRPVQDHQDGGDRPVAGRLRP